MNIDVTKRWFCTQLCYITPPIMPKVIIKTERRKIITIAATTSAVVVALIVLVAVGGVILKTRRYRKCLYLHFQQRRVVEWECGGCEAVVCQESLNWSGWVLEWNCAHHQHEAQKLGVSERMLSPWGLEDPSLQVHRQPWCWPNSSWTKKTSGIMAFAFEDLFGSSSWSTLTTCVGPPEWSPGALRRATFCWTRIWSPLLQILD